MHLATRPHHCTRPCNDRARVFDVAQALVYFQTDSVAQCPSSSDELMRLGYLGRPPVDCHGRPLRFICPGTHDPDGADVSAAGPDRRFGTTDDVTSW